MPRLSRLCAWRSERAATNGTEIREAVACVEHVVADKLPGGSMELVCSGAREHVDDTACHDAVLGAVDVRLHLELAHRIDDRQEPIDGAAKICVDDTVHQVQRLAVLLTKEGDLVKLRTRNRGDS